MLFQIRYYKGEESKHDAGLGVAPGNLACDYTNIEEKCSSSEIMKNEYLIRGTLVELVHKPFGWVGGKDWGKLCIRLISDSKINLEKTAQVLNMPFTEEVIVPYSN